MVSISVPIPKLRAFSAIACLAGTLSAAGHAQSPGVSAKASPSSNAGTVASPVFDVADVHVSARTQYPNVRGGGLHGDRYLLRQATMVDLIAAAYKVDPLNVLGGPAWLELDRFDIAAKAPRGTSQEPAALMLRALLADRFKLDVHAEIRPQPAYVLTAGKNPKLKQAEGSGGQGCSYQQPAKDAPPAARMNIAFACRNTTMESFAEFLHNVGRPYMARPVIDSTELKGAWDFDFQWSFQPPRAGADGITIFDAIDRQLGLRLELKSAPLPVVVVNSVNEKLTPNPSEAATSLPPRTPAEFEVATVRPQAPREKHFNIQIDGSGKIAIQHASVETLIAFAWDIDKEMIVRGANAIDQDFYDVVGKASTDPPVAGPGSGPGVDIDDLREMLRSLLADRFQLKVHTEDRPFDAYNLYAANPKMKKADPANRASCKPGPGPDGKDPRQTNPALTRLISCQNITMAQFVAQFRTLAPGNIKTEVLDETGLPGAYDFVLYWSGENDGPLPPPAPGDGIAPTDPSTAIPLTEALSKQLGLKLEKQKRPVAMLVIDHVDPKPAEN